LQPLTTEAEINPVVRHLFRQLYGMDLPQSIDLSETTLTAFYQELSGTITASEPGVTLNLIDRPRVEVIHDLAQRRLERHRRSARLSGKGVKTFLGVDYSYDRINFHPLGLALFQARVRPSPTRLRATVRAKSAPRSHLRQPEGGGLLLADDGEPRCQIHSHEGDEGSDANRFEWDFDLC